MQAGLSEPYVYPVHLQGGKMYPERAVLYMALGEAQWITTYEEGTYDFWVSLNHVYNLDMSLLADHAVARYKGIIRVLFCTDLLVLIFVLVLSF